MVQLPKPTIASLIYTSVSEFCQHSAEQRKHRYASIFSPPILNCNFFFNVPTFCLYCLPLIKDCYVFDVMHKRI